MLARHCADYLELAVLADAAQGSYSAAGDGLLWIGDQRFRAHVGHCAQALAVGAVTLRRVEGERMRLRLLERYARFGVYQMLGEVPDGAVVSRQNGYGALSDADSAGNGAAYPCLISLAGLELVYHQLYEVGLVAVYRFQRTQLKDLRVNTYLGVAAPAHLLEQLAVVAFSAPHQGRQKYALAAGVFLHYEVYDLGVRISYHLFSAHGGVCR